MSKKDSNRYAFDKLPISDKTKAGMKLSIDDVGILGRMLSIQDLVNDEEHEEINKTLVVINTTLIDIGIGVAELRKEVGILTTKVDQLDVKVVGLEGKVGKVTRTVDQTKIDVDNLTIEVVRLKKINSAWYYILRVAIAALAAIGMIRLLHGAFFS